MKYLLLAITCLTTLVAQAQIIPLPLEDRARTGEVILAGEVMVAAPLSDTEIYLQTLRGAGVSARLVPADARAAIQFLSPDSLPDRFPIPKGEGYVIRITPQVINVHAASPSGHFHGLQTLAQIIESARQADGQPIRLACRDIVDSPRFAWRGFMLDESRHFTGPDGVKRLIDAMARFKLNRLHWHLTDSPAWRIEIKKYPELTRTGGRGSETDRSPDAPVILTSCDTTATRPAAAGADSIRSMMSISFRRR